MNILIIGSKGFIGTHCARILGMENTVYGCDVVTDYVSAGYYQVDATNADYKDIFKSQQFDVCINCSGASSVPDSFNHPLRDFSLNTYNVIKILEAIKELQPGCRFVNLSSAAVYGDPLKLPIAENFDLSPLSPYGFHKKYSEEIISEYSRFFNIKVCSLRIFSAYGPGLKKQLLWDIFIKSRSETEVKLFGNGNETRDFIHIIDIVNAINIIINDGSFSSGVYNVASGKAISVDEIAQKLLTELNYKGKLSYTETQRAGDPIKWQADISALKALGFEPAYDIDLGIKNTAEWLKGLDL